ncbi:MAG: tetratricopeptide repeat protein [Armatimonadota bacterium]
MTRYAVFLLLIISACAAFLCSPVIAEDKARPVVLLFQTEKTQDFEAPFAAATTRALRNYFRDTQRVESMIFDRESATVERAVLDRRLSADSVASYSTREQRVEVAKVLGFQYASGADLSFETPKDYTAKVLKLKVWLVEVNAGPKGVWEATGSAIYSNAGDMALDNAMQSAASKAVIDVTRQAFSKLPVVNSVAPISGGESNAIGGATNIEAKQPNAGDYSSQAEEDLSAGNLAVAIQEYSRAVSVDPSNIPLRIKLAETYARKKMFNEAFATLDAALQVGADSGLVDAARQKIQRMQSGQTPSIAEPKAEAPKTNESKPMESAPQPPIISESKPKDAISAAVAKLVEGDKLWNKGDPDEAAKTYIEAIRLNPDDWRAHERLAIVDASMSLFNESRKALEQLKVVQSNPSPDIVGKRYEMLRKVFDKSFKMLLQQYESDTNDFTTKRITRESYYSTINGLSLRSESMAKFLDALTVPPLKQPANIHRSLACGLFAQAASSMLEYLETNSAQSKANAQIFLDQARKELEAAANLDENKVVVTKEQPKPTVEPEPAIEPGSEPAEPVESDY